MNEQFEQLLEKIKRNAFQKEEASPVELDQFKTLLAQTRTELYLRHKQMESGVPTVKQLFASVRFHDLLTYLEAYTDMDEETYQQYKAIFEQVKKKESAYEEHFMLVDTEEAGAPDVYSIAYDNGIHYSFSLVPYAQLANYKIHPTTYETYSKEEISAAILEEFSWATDDEFKEETTEELTSLKEEAEKYAAIEQAEEEGVVSIFGKNEGEHPFRLKRNHVTVISDNETIRQYAQTISFEKIKKVIDTHCDDFEEVLKLPKEDIVRLIENQFFAIKKTINQAPKAPKGYDLSFNRLQNFAEVKRKDARIKGLYSGTSVYEVVDEHVNRCQFFSTYTKEEIYVCFLMTVLREEVTCRAVGSEEHRRMVQMVKRNQETKRILEKAKNDIQTLKTEELLVFSHIIESIEEDY